MNVAHLLIGQAAQRPTAAAIIEKAGRNQLFISFADLDARSAQGAALLASSGIGVGDHVLVFVPMSIELYVALIAIFRVGAVATFLDPSAGRDHIARCCELVPPAGMIAVSKAHLLRLIAPALRKIRCKFSVGWSLFGAQRWEHSNRVQADPRIAERAADNSALITFTSGSTGRPKAAMRSHGFLVAQHEVLSRTIELAPGQVDLATLPIFTLANLASGVTSVIPDADLRRPGSVKPAPILAQVREHKVTRTAASPAFLERLLGDSDAGEVMKSFNRIYTGGAPVFPGLLRRLQQCVPAARVVAVYGSTEAEPIAHIGWDEISPEDIDAMFGGRGLLAGPAVKDIQLRVIVDQSGKTLPAMTSGDFEKQYCGIGEAGEIVVTGAHVLPGYLNGDGNSETKFLVDGNVWHRTGDTGYLDDHDRLWLLGRAQARIVDEHGMIYPFAVECAASQVAGIKRSALIQVRGRRVLVIEPVPDAPANLVQKVTAILSWAKLHEVRVVKRIPVDKRHNAKIDYAELAQVVGQTRKPVSSATR